MKKSVCFLFSALLCLFLVPLKAQAQGAAPGLYGVGEIVVDYVKFDDPKASDICSLSREDIAVIIAKSFAGTNVPVTAVVDVKPPVAGVARINLVSEISTIVDDSMNCMSWISLSAESRASIVIPPVTTLRGVTVVYWRQHNRVVSGQSLHPERIGETLKKMIDQFAQQYRIDQPVVMRK
jgi:hypothetical protein